jgi:hypothetical protein
MILSDYCADVATGCQVFHICSRTSLKLKSFLCSNGFIFNQELTWDWWNNMDCSMSEKYYNLNMGISRKD